MGRKSRKKLYQFVDALVDIGSRELVGRLQVSDEAARELMRDVARGMCFRYAKTIMYIPADIEFDLSQRDEQIWQEYGEDGPDGAKKFTPARIAQIGENRHLSVAHVYCIVRAIRQRDNEARQGVFPGVAEPG